MPDSQHPIDALFQTIRARKDASPAESYTAKLIGQGLHKCAKKLGEEAVEAALAAVDGTKDDLASESADLLYHLLVVWAARGVSPADVYAVLRERQGKSGLAEKNGRKG